MGKRIKRWAGFEPAYLGWTKKLRQTEPLTHLCYHIGNVATDRQYDRVLDKLAALLMGLSELGYVVLYQTRQDHDMHYYAVPVFRPLIERPNPDPAIEEKIVEYGPLSRFRGSRGHEDGCIAEAERLLGMPISERRRDKETKEERLLS